MLTWKLFVNPFKLAEKAFQKGYDGPDQYTLELLKQMQKDIEEIKLSQCMIFASLKGLFNFQKPFIERIACSDY